MKTKHTLSAATLIVLAFCLLVNVGSLFADHAGSISDFDSIAIKQKAGGEFPIMAADGSVIFLYQGTGKEKTVRLTGEFKTESFYSSNWDKDGVALAPLAENSDVFFVKMRIEPTARLEYQFIVDGERKLDPLNPRKTFNGVVASEVSELVMPKYPLPDDGDNSEKISKGTIQPLTADWVLAPISVYLPAGYSSARSYSVVYTADGSAWLKYMALAATLDRLIDKKMIEPVIVVMIDPTEDRRNWYLFNSEYLKYLDKIVRFVDGHYSTKADPKHRLHLGTSAGGRAALYAGFERPDLFLNLALLSPSLTGSVSYFAPYFSGKKRLKRGLKVWISAGSYEGSLSQDAKTMEKYFKANGVKVRGNYTHEGHSLQAWRYQAPLALRYFYRASK